MMQSVRILMATFFFTYGLASLSVQIVGRPGFGRFGSPLAAIVAIGGAIIVLPRPRHKLVLRFVFIVGVIQIAAVVSQWPAPLNRSDLGILALGLMYVALGWRSSRIQPAYRADIAVLQNPAGIRRFGFGRLSVDASKLMTGEDHIQVRRGYGRQDEEFFRGRPVVEIPFSDVVRIRWRWLFSDLTLFIKRPSGRLDEVSIEALPRTNGSWGETRAVYLALRERWHTCQRKQTRAQS
jgi:hypothetical protein